MDQKLSEACCRPSETGARRPGAKRGFAFATPLFTQLSIRQKVRFLAHCEWLATRPEQIITREGEPIQDYYFIEWGRFRYSRGQHGKAIVLAERGAGERFGETGLITGNPAEATVIALTSGALIRLPQSDFHELLLGPALTAVSPTEANQLTAAGARWLDARPQPGAHPAFIAAPEHWPAERVRQDYARLAREPHYLSFCEDGRDSAVVAFLLAERGYTASYLAGGISLLTDARRRPGKQAVSLSEAGRAPRLALAGGKTLLRSDLFSSRSPNHDLAEKLRERHLGRLDSSTWRPRAPAGNRTGHDNATARLSDATPARLMESLQAAARIALAKGDPDSMAEVMRLLELPREN